MESQKPQNNIDALLALAEQPPAPGEVYDELLTNIKLFCHELKIGPGDKKIFPIVIYYHYLQWFKQKYKFKKPETFYTFFAEFANYYRRYRISKGGNIVYMLDPSSFDLSINIWTIRNELRKPDERQNKTIKRSKK